MRDQMQQRDLLAVAAGYGDPFWQELRYRIIGLYFAAFHHLGEQQRRKHLGDGADLEDAVFGQLLVAVPVSTAVDEDLPAVRDDDSGYDSDCLLLHIHAAHDCLTQILRLNAHAERDHPDAVFHKSFPSINDSAFWRALRSLRTA